MDLNEAVYHIRSKEKMLRADFSVGSGNSKEWLENLIAEAARTTKTELRKQVKGGYLTKDIASNIAKALIKMPHIEITDANEAVAVFPEFKFNELHICTVAIRLKENVK